MSKMRPEVLGPTGEDSEVSEVSLSIDMYDAPLFV